MDRQADLAFDLQPPRAGTVLVQTVTVAAVIDLANSGPTGISSNFNAGGQFGAASQAASAGGAAPAVLNQGGFIGHWIDIFADGGDIGFITGPTSASVSGANAPVLATTGAAGTAGTCFRIPNGQFRTYYLKSGDDRFLGVVSAGTTTLRIALSSR